MSVQIIIIIGHTGAGKTTLAQALGKKYGLSVLSFHDAGKELASTENGSLRFNEIASYLYEGIVSAANTNKPVIADGLAVAGVVERLIASEYAVKTIYLDTPYELRIERIRQRHFWSAEAAENIERSKADGKDKGGIASVIGMADVVFNGSRQVVEVAADFDLWYSTIREGKEEACG